MSALRRPRRAGPQRDDILMKRLLCLATAVCIALFANLAGAATRSGEPINRDWTFTLGDPAGAQAVDHDASRWRRVDLPHSFSEPYFLGTGFYVGHGWYRKHLDAAGGAIGPAHHARVRRRVPGSPRSGSTAEGRRAHVGGYTGFSIDITPYAKAGRNLVAVHVNNEWNARVAPRAGEHVFSGGIYRNVRLVVTDPVHVAWYGTFVTTPQVSTRARDGACADRGEQRARRRREGDAGLRGVRRRRPPRAHGSQRTRGAGRRHRHLRPDAARDRLAAPVVAREPARSTSS